MVTRSERQVAQNGAKKNCFFFCVSLFILLMRFVFPTISVDANRITMAEGVVGLDGHIG